jgi:chaperonin cofactor prefoldin
MAQGKSKASGATTDREKRLQAKIKRLERQNEGLAKRIVELRENYDCLLDAYKSLKDAMFYKPNVIKYHK